MITIDQLKRGRVFYDIERFGDVFEPVWLKITKIEFYDVEGGDGYIEYVCDGNFFSRGHTTVSLALANFVKTKAEAKAYIKAENAKVAS